MSHRSADLCNVQYALALQVEHQNNSFILKKKNHYYWAACVDKGQCTPLWRSCLQYYYLKVLFPNFTYCETQKNVNTRNIQNWNAIVSLGKSQSDEKNTLQAHTCSLWFCALLTCPDLCCVWSQHKKHCN